MTNFFDGGVAQWGPNIYAGVMWGACGLALAEGAVMALSGPNKTALRTGVSRSLPWGLGLAAAQLAAILAADRLGGFNLLAGSAVMYFFFALLLPVLWATGRVWAQQSGIPAKTGYWSARSRKILMSGLVVAGVGLSLLLVTLVDVSTGAAVRELTAEGGSDLAVGVLVAWLLFNAPWQEELLFRHYLVPRLAAIGAGRFCTAAMIMAVVITSAIFALGHGGHFEPAWPKLVQTFIWGLMLGGVRIWLGTAYAIGLHLMFNLSAPLMAPFVSS